MIHGLTGRDSLSHKDYFKIEENNENLLDFGVFSILAFFGV
jgi:hypothetical protein